MAENRNDFTQGRIVSKLLRFMVPILGALILQAMYGAVDILVVGQFGTTAGISGVSTGSNIVNLITFTITGLTMGVTVVMGQYLGQKKTEKVGLVVGGAICLFLVLAVIIAAAMLLFARPLAVLMQAPEEALDLTVLYVRICGGGIFFIIAYNVISSIFRDFLFHEHPARCKPYHDWFGGTLRNDIWDRTECFVFYQSESENDRYG